MTTTMTTTTMMATMTTGLFAALATAGLVASAGCGSSSSCDDAIKNAAKLRNLESSDALVAIQRCKRERWSDDLRGCVAKASSTGALDACAEGSRRSAGPDDAFASYMKKSKASEAEIRLRMLEKDLKMIYAENAAFPIGTSGPTPAAGSCCRGPNHKCAPEPSLWRDDPVWSALDFELDEPHLYSYAYRGDDGQHAVVEATGDLDCDGDTSTYTMRCEAVTGNPTCAITRPARVD